MKSSKYDPKSDPLMPRLFRKFDPKKSTIIQAKRMGSAFNSQISKFDNGQKYKAGGGYGSQRTYLCINPYRSLAKNPAYRS